MYHILLVVDLKEIGGKRCNQFVRNKSKIDIFDIKKNI